jgi:hypothetical protein
MTLSEADLLRVWEAGMAQSPAGRALVLLAAAIPGVDMNQLAQLTIGERDELLLDLRQECFGPGLDGRVDCPGCAAPLELALDADQLRDAAPQPALAGGRVFAAGHEVRFRLPTSHDVLAVDTAGASGPYLVLARCVLEATAGGATVPAADLDGGVLDAVAAAMADLDSRIDIKVALTCPACGHCWAPALDIAAYLWAEIDASARRLLHTVHALASGYGWTETDVLAVGPWRRQAYLQAVGG